MDDQETLSQAGGAAIGNRGSTPSMPPSSNDPGTTMDHAGTGIPTLAPYEIPAPKEPHHRVGSEAEANPNRKTKNKKKK